LIAEPRLSQHYLLPGELLVRESPTMVSTVLGSSVAMTVHAPIRKVGGICYVILLRGTMKRAGTAALLQ